MPKLKRKTSQVPDEAIYAMYDGPIPPSGVYPGVITSCYMSTSSNGNPMINVSGVLETAGVEGKEKYNGYRQRGRVVIVDKEANMAREKAFYRAIAGKEDVELVYTDMDKGDKPGTITKVGGVNPVGKKVKFQIRSRPDEDQYGPDLDYILPFGPASSAKAVEEDDEEEDIVEEEELEEGEGVVPDYHSMSLTELRKFAESEHDITTKAKKDILAALDEIYSEDEDDEVEETGLWTSDEARSSSLEDLQAYSAEHGVKAKKISGMKKGALVKFLAAQNLLSDTPPF